jgi:hypothetical protein
MARKSAGCRYEGESVTDTAKESPRARDTRPAVWAKKVKKWRRWMAELKTEAGVDTTVPGDFDVPPHQRTCPATFTADLSGDRCRMLVVNVDGDVFWW